MGMRPTRLAVLAAIGGGGGARLACRDTIPEVSRRRSLLNFVAGAIAESYLDHAYLNQLRVLMDGWVRRWHVPLP